MNNGVPPLFGWLHLKLKKNKWEKRYVYLRDGAIYHAKDSKVKARFLWANPFTMRNFLLSSDIWQAINFLFDHTFIQGVNETFLCTIASFDVYTLTKPLKRAPTKFAFALKSQDKITMFESPDQDYVHFLCAERLEKMKDWVLSIRNAKVYITF